MWSINLKNLVKKSLKERPVSLSDLTLFFRQFSTLIEACIALPQACYVLEKCQSPSFQTILLTIRQSLLAGKSLSAALSQHPKHFNNFICQLIHIGEKTGRLSFVLITIANHLEKDLLFKKQIKQSLFYPMIVLLISILITFLMFIYIIPKFAALFADIHNQLPLLTLIIFYFSEKLNQYFIPFFLFLFFLFFCLFSWAPLHRAALLKNFFRHIVSKIPALNAQVNKMVLARFARNLSLTFSSGISINEAISLSAKACANQKLVHIANQLNKKISLGLPLYYGMTVLPLFPELMIQMVKIGEESGKLPAMLDKTADFFESELEQGLKYLMQLLEPLIMLLLGVLIGGLILGMYLPIFKLGNAL